MNMHSALEIEPCLARAFPLFSVFRNIGDGHGFENKFDFPNHPPDKFHEAPFSNRLVIILTAVFLFLMFVQGIRIKNHKKCKTIWEILPGPRRLWLIGNAHLLWSPKERLETLTTWCLQYGPYFQFKLGRENKVILTSPEAIQKLLASNNDGHLSKGDSYDVFVPFWKDGVVISRANKWKSRRRFMSRAFTLKSFLGYMHVYNKESKELVKELINTFRNGTEERSGKPIDKLLWKSTLRVICETTMGTDIWDIEGIDKLTSTLNMCKQLCMMRALKPWLMIDWIWKLHPKSKELQVGGTMLENFTRKVIDKMKLRVMKEVDNSCPTVKRSFKSMMEEMLASGFHDEALTEEVQTLITTGYETTSSTIQFTLFLLALNPDHQTLCREEIDRVFQDGSLCPNGDLTFDALSELKHLERCIHETLRLYPVTFMYIRKLEASLRIDDNLEIPPGVNVGVFVPGVHRNPEYFPNPDVFDPDRFLAENASDRNQYAYIPFSAGPRNCIGFKFGLIEVKVMVARIIRHFIIKLASDDSSNDDVAVFPDIVLTPERGYNFLLEERKI